VDKSISLSRSITHFFTLMMRPIADHVTYTVRSGVAAGLKRRGGYGFLPLPRPVSDEEKLYLTLDLAGKVFYDVGSYEGIISLFAARAVGPQGTLVIVEPNPQCFQRTQRNLELNQFRCKIIHRNAALGAKRGLAKMWSPSGDDARSTLNPKLASWYAESGETCGEFQVELDTLDEMIEDGFPVPQFVKIDTEGHEFDVLRGAERTLRCHRPELLVEMHGTTHQNWITNRQNVQRFVTACGYSVFDLHLKPVLETEPGTYLYCKS
jgi:FkbM family methyltransferase